MANKTEIIDPLDPNYEAKEEVKQMTQEEYLNEKVPFYAFKDDKDYKDDLIVGVNGYNYVIKRGVQQMIPRKVLHILESSQRMATEQIKRLEEFAKAMNEQNVAIG